MTLRIVPEKINYMGEAWWLIVTNNVQWSGDLSSNMEKPIDTEIKLVFAKLGESMNLLSILRGVH